MKSLLLLILLTLTIHANTSVCKLEVVKAPYGEMRFSTWCIDSTKWIRYDVLTQMFKRGINNKISVIPCVCNKKRR